MEKEKLKALFASYLEDKLPPEEIQALFSQPESEHDPETIRQLVRDRIAKLKKQDFGDDPGLRLVYDRVYQRILSETEDRTAASGDTITVLPVKRKYWLRIAASAAILALLGAGSYFGYFHTASQQDQFTPVMSDTNDLLPGSNRAVLTLSDGSRVLLDHAGVGELAEQSGIRISKSKDGTIVYNASSYTGEENAAVSYNTISTPTGGQYQVILPDGTKAWLNAASTLRYPAAFRGKERKVELAGEAYFEVAPNESSPFIVNTLDQQIRVLGTHFNVKAYADEAETRTSLLEGAVKITSGDHTQLLKPGQQARVLSGKDEIKIVRNANMEAAVAWKNGQFIFEGEGIESIMKKISRWYNAEIIYQGEITDNEFIGTISRFENVSEVLNLLELTGTVHFKIEAPSSRPTERRIIVMP